MSSQRAWDFSKSHDSNNRSSHVYSTIHSFIDAIHHGPHWDWSVSKATFTEVSAKVHPTPNIAMNEFYVISPVPYPIELDLKNY